MRARASACRTCGAAIAIGLAAMTATAAGGQPVWQTGRPRPPAHGQPAKRLAIAGAMVIYGNGKPPFGPVDVVVEDGLIAYVGPPKPELRASADATIDATGTYVLPGFVNTHVHLRDERAGRPQPVEYTFNLLLAAGITTVRSLGADFEKGKAWRQHSAARRLAAPRILVYPWSLGVVSQGSPSQIRKKIQDAKARGADGLKLRENLDRDQLEAALDEARRQGLRVAAHIGFEETTARDYVELGVDSIEHFYGIPDAALDGLRPIPPDVNIADGLDKFGKVAADAFSTPNLNRAKLSALFDTMVAKGVSWSPTMSVYSANRDLIRAQNLPWFAKYLHPATAAFWEPSLENSALSGSYFVGWTSTQEARWHRMFDIWKEALREFGAKGGNITTGDDAEACYNLYGFGFVRELELHEEAGFHPLEVIRHATVNGARLLGLDDRIGRVRAGYVADLIVVNGNPLENLRLLTPGGTDVNVNGRNARGGGIEWTIKDGVPYHVPRLLRETEAMVAAARKQSRISAR